MVDNLIAKHCSWAEESPLADSQDFPLPTIELPDRRVSLKRLFSNRTAHSGLSVQMLDWRGQHSKKLGFACLKHPLTEART